MSSLAANEIGTFSDVLFYLERHGIAQDCAREIVTTVFGWGIDAAIDRLRPTRPRPADVPPVTAEQLALIEQDPTPAKPAKKLKPAKIARRIPEDFALTDALTKFATDRGFSRPQIDHMFESFTNYYRASGKTWADWDAVWRQWVNRQRDRANGGPGRPDLGGGYDGRL